MEPFLGAVEATEIARWLRASRWGYAAVNGLHVLGIALLVGAVVPLNLRLLGAWPDIERAQAARLLVPAAACGLALAVATGLLLFSIRARDYAALEILQVKLLLVLAGTASAILAHRAGGRWLQRAAERRLAAHAAVSLACWGGALACGRLIAFAGD